MARVVVLAGRRIDAFGSPRRFPLENTEAVAEDLRVLLVDHEATALVCSAACGADLLALEVATALGMRRRVVLPFARERFRETSVIDRPGDWGPRYDRAIDAVEAAGDLIVLEAEEGDEAYAATTRAILDEGVRLWRSESDVGASRADVGAPDVVAVMVWEGKSRGAGDHTEELGVLARERGLTVVQVLTVER